MLTDFAARHGGFDVLLGFSQGAAAGAVLCADDGMRARLGPLKRAVLVGGFVPRATALQATITAMHQKQQQQQQVDFFPTLHVAGGKDKIVPREGTLALAKLFPNSEVYEHSGGHYIPHDAQFVSVLLRFLQVGGKESADGGSGDDGEANATVAAKL